MRRTTRWSSKAASGREGKGIWVTLTVAWLVPDWLVSLLHQSIADPLEFSTNLGFTENGQKEKISSERKMPCWCQRSKAGECVAKNALPKAVVEVVLRNVLKIHFSICFKINRRKRLCCHTGNRFCITCLQDFPLQLLTLSHFSSHWLTFFRRVHLMILTAHDSSLATLCLPQYTRWIKIDKSLNIELRSAKVLEPPHFYLLLHGWDKKTPFYPLFVCPEQNHKSLYSSSSSSRPAKGPWKRRSPRLIPLGASAHSLLSATSKRFTVELARFHIGQSEVLVQMGWRVANCFHTCACFDLLSHWPKPPNYQTLLLWFWPNSGRVKAPLESLVVRCSESKLS